MPCLVHVLLFCCYFVCFTLQAVVDRRGAEHGAPHEPDARAALCDGGRAHPMFVQFTIRTRNPIPTWPGPPTTRILGFGAGHPQKEQPLQLAVQMLAAEQ